MLKGIRGFTLIELVIVMVILGILAAIAMPKFVDLITDANIAATKAGLGAIRGVIALQYAHRLAGGASEAEAYNIQITAGDFFDGKMPVNKLNKQEGVEYLSGGGYTLTNPTDPTYGWWYASTGSDVGEAGALSDGKVNTLNW